MVPGHAGPRQSYRGSYGFVLNCLPLVRPGRSMTRSISRFPQRVTALQRSLLPVALGTTSLAVRPSREHLGIGPTISATDFDRRKDRTLKVFVGSDARLTRNNASSARLRWPGGARHRSFVIDLPTALTTPVRIRGAARVARSWLRQACPRQPSKYNLIGSIATCYGYHHPLSAHLRQAGPAGVA